MNLQDYIKSIIASLSWLSKQVEFHNKLNLTDINVQAENFYRDLLNLSLNTSFININSIDQNSAAIDLGDQKNRIAIQVTSTSALSKTKKTVTKFIEKKLHEKYDRLIILNISKKSNHTPPTIGDETFKINTKNDIWDIGDLIKKINNLKLHEIESIKTFLDQHLYVKPTESLPRNVDTILRLIELISNEDHPAIGEGTLEEPFPDHKINQRFSDHADFLKSEFFTLYQDYGAVLNAVEKESDISQVKIRRVAQHLRLSSDTLLTKNDGDPKKALTELMDYFLDLLQKNGFEADTGAAQFYIMQHLVRCNVFPNKEVVDG
ncbi:SMEK domain-containing protein [Marinobacter lacisalsi]|uniref:SMEK domain-containing protein n=1 Tax=Marinobacter lacisalsi TaxID=475979 RepID=A0ABV8QGY5_9GAMM